MKTPKKVRDLIAWLQVQERLASLTARLREEQRKTDRLYAEWRERQRGGGGDGF